MLATIKKMIKGVLGQRYLDVREWWVRSRFPAIKKQLGAALAGEIPIDNRPCLYRVLTSDDQNKLTQFLTEGLSEEDIALLGLSARGVDFHNPAHLYLGLFDADGLIALNWIRIDDLRLLEKGSAVAVKWRRQGLYHLLHRRFCDICERLGFAHYMRTARDNTVMVRFLTSRGYTQYREVDDMLYWRIET